MLENKTAVSMKKTPLVRRISNMFFRFSIVLSIVLLALVFAVSAGVTRLSFNADYKVFFDKENKELQDNDTLNSYFNKRETILFVINNPSGSVFSTEGLNASRALTEEAWSIPHVTRVDSLVNYPRAVATEEEITVEDLVPEGFLLSEEFIAEIKGYALDQPAIVDKVVASDGGATGVIATLILPESDPFASIAATQRAEEILDELREEFGAGLEFGVTGLVPIAASYPKASQADVGKLGPLLLLVTAVALLVQLKSVIGTLGSMIVIFLSSITAFGFAGWGGILLTPPSVMAPLIILTIAVADCVHILMSIGHSRGEGRSKRETIEVGLARALLPVTLTSFTTAAGFLALNLAESPPYRDMGNMAAVGVVIAWALSVTLLPLMARAIPLFWYERPKFRVSSAYSRVLINISHNYGRTLLIVGAALVVISVPLVLTLKIDDNIVEYFDESTQIRQDSELALNNLTGVYSLEFAVSSGSDGGIADPEYLDRLERFTIWLRDQPEVRAVDSFSDRIKEMNASLHADNPAYRRLPETRQEAAQYILLYEFSLPYGRELTDQIDLRKSMTRVMASLERVQTSEIIDLTERSKKWFSDQDNEEPLAAGVVLVFSHLSHHNIGAMVVAILWMMLTIAVIIAAYVRQWRLVAIALLANTAPMLIALALWGSWRGFVNTPASIAVVIALGLVVDGTIHLLHEFYQNRFKSLKSAEEAVENTLRRIGPPITVSSITLILGFLILSMSEFRMNSDLGLLSSAIIFVALLFDLLLIPAALARFSGEHAQETNASGAL